MHLPTFGTTVNVDQSRINRAFGPDATQGIKGQTVRLQKALQDLPDDKVCIDITPTVAPIHDKLTHKAKGKEVLLSAKIQVVGKDGQTHKTQVNQASWSTRRFEGEGLMGLFRRIEKTTRQFVETHGLQEDPA